MSDLVQADDESVEPKCEGAPKRIFLVVGDLDEDCKFDDLDDVTWCIDKIGNQDIEYVRADEIAMDMPPTVETFTDEQRLEAIGKLGFWGAEAAEWIRELKSAYDKAFAQAMENGQVAAQSTEALESERAANARLTEENEQLRADKATLTQTYNQLFTAYQELQADAEKYRADAERFKFIESNLVQGHSPHMDSTFLWAMRLPARGRTFAEAIDAQRAGEKG